MQQKKQADNLGSLAFILLTCVGTLVLLLLASLAYIHSLPIREIPTAEQLQQDFLDNEGIGMRGPKFQALATHLAFELLDGRAFTIDEVQRYLGLPSMTLSQPDEQHLIWTYNRQGGKDEFVRARFTMTGLLKGGLEFGATPSLAEEYGLAPQDNSD